MWSNHEMCVFSEKELKEWVSPRLIPNQSTDAWVDGILREYMRLRGTTAAQAKVLYLESAKQFKHYGASLFPVKVSEGAPIRQAKGGHSILL